MRSAKQISFSSKDLSSLGAAEAYTSNDLLLLQKENSQPLFPSQLPEFRIVQLTEGKPALYRMPVMNAENQNSAIIISYQVSTRLRNYDSISLCSHIPYVVIRPSAVQIFVQVQMTARRHSESALP